MSNPFSGKSPLRIAALAMAVVLALWVLKAVAVRFTAVSVPPTVPPPLPLAATAAAASAAPSATRWTCVPGPTRFDSGFEATALMLLPWSKDESYRDLARRALCVEDYVVFRDAASRIGYLVERDDTWFDGVEFTLAARKPALAKTFVDRIEQPALRDEAHRRVVAAVTEAR